jgi:ankyrin repeat protein
MMTIIGFKHDRVKQFVRETATVIDEESNEAMTCLHFAARDGRCKLLAALLAIGASAAAVDDVSTDLHHCA